MRSRFWLSFILLSLNFVVLPASAQSLFDVEDVLGDWYTPEGTKAFTIDRAVSTGLKAQSEVLALSGKYTDWTGVMTARGTVIFTRNPSSEQMNSMGPEWARQMVEKEKTLHWELNLQLRKGCSELVLEGKFYRGMLEWVEETDQSDKVLKREAHNTGKRGDPQPRRYTKISTDPALRHDPGDVQISSLEIDDPARSRVKALRDEVAAADVKLDAVWGHIATLQTKLFGVQRDQQATREKSASGIAAAAAKHLEAMQHLEKLIAPDIRRGQLQKELDDVTASITHYDILPDAPESEVLQARYKELLDELELLRAREEKEGKAHEAQIKAASAEVDKTAALMQAATAANDAAAAAVSAALDRLAGERRARQEEGDRRLKLYRSILAASSKRLVDAVTIRASQQTLVSAVLAHQNEPGSAQAAELADLDRKLDLAQSAMNVNWAAKEEALEAYKAEQRFAIDDLNKLEALIRWNSRKKYGAKLTDATQKVVRATMLEGGPIAGVVEGMSQIAGQAVENYMERDRRPGADERAIERELIIERGVAKELGETLEGEKGAEGWQDSVRERMATFASAKAGEKVADVNAKLGEMYLTNLGKRGAMYEAVAKNYHHVLEQSALKSWSFRGLDLATSIAVEGYAYHLDSQEAQLWRDYYIHDISGRLAWGTWYGASKTYWESVDAYDELQQEMSHKLEEISSPVPDLRYTVSPALPVRTQECAQLEIAVTPASDSDRETVQLNGMTADRLSSDAPDHQYRFKIPLVEEGGARELKVRVLEAPK